ncbi:hypothetical protein LBMAG37_14680 [Anaerolineae bacterium]|nr:hypothetical protein LBMAG37_14680 [Anaerolineae bacterium]
MPIFFLSPVWTLNAIGFLETGAVGAEALSTTRVLIAALLAAVAMSSVVIGAWAGLTFKVSSKVIANILAFGSGALVNALAVDLAFGTTEHLVHLGVPNLTAWAVVAGGFFTGGLIYFSANRMIDSAGGAARHQTNARAFALEKKQELAGGMLELLGKNEVMRSLPPAEIDALIPYLQEFETSEGSYLFKQGEAGDALYLITSGSLGVFVRKEGDAEGDGTRVDGITHGQVVGEMALLGGGVRNATILAESDVQAVKIDSEDFEHLMKDAPGLRAAVEDLKRERVLKTMQREAALMDSTEWAKLATQSIRTMSASEIHDVLAEHGGGSPLAIWMGNILDAIPGSLVIGATFLGMASFNPTLLVAIFLANLPEAMASALTMRQAGYSNAKIYGLWGSLVIIGAIFAAIGNVYLPPAPVELLALFEAIAGGAILALVAQVMFPHAFEEGGDVVSISTITGFMVAFLLTALDIHK